MNKNKKKIPWYENWFDKNYLLLYHHRNSVEAKAQVNLIIRELSPKKNCLILDLACGDGRYTHLLKNEGYNTIGLDLSRELIQEGKDKHGPMNLIVGDMRTIPGKYDIILSLFTSFGYFDDDKENFKVFRSVSSALRRNGWFWLDFLNPNFVQENLIPETVTEVSSVCKVIERRKIVSNRIIKDIMFFMGDEEKHYRESIRLYSRTELESMFRHAGIQTVGCYGDYWGNQWAKNTERTIIYGRKQIE